MMDTTVPKPRERERLITVSEEEGEGEVEVSVPPPRPHPALRRTHSEVFIVSLGRPLTSRDQHNENLYRGMVRSLLHQVGRTDQHTGMRPGDLIDHIRQVFEVDQEDHEYFVRDELRNKPRHIQANVTVIEASNLKQSSDRSNGEIPVYCLLTVARPQRASSTNTNTNKGVGCGGPRGTTSSSSSSHSPRASPSPKGGSPRVSPMPSPHHSPRVAKKKGSPPARSPSLEWCGEVVRSQPYRGAGPPKWQEQFQLEVEDPQTDELHLCLCHHDDGSGTGDKYSGVRCATEKSGALKGFFKNILQTSDHDRLIPGCVGQAVLPLRDVPSEGYEGWVDVYPVSGSRSRSVGSCHLQVSLSYKQDSLYGGRFCSEDYHQAALLCYKHALANLKGREGTDLLLSAQSRRSLDIFAVVNGVSRLSQTIMELTVQVELARVEEGGVSSAVLHKAVERVQMTWAGQHGSGLSSLHGLPLSDAEICLYRTTARAFISHLLAQLDTMHPLFPPSTDTFATLKQRFSIVQHLVELDVWEGTSCPKADLSASLLVKLQADIAGWVEEQLRAAEEEGVGGEGCEVKDAVLPKVKAVVGVLNSLTSHCTRLGVVHHFFLGLDVPYYRTVAFDTERRVGAVVRGLMMEMDRYQSRYHSFPVNIQYSSRLALSLFFALRSYLHTVRHNLSERDMFRLTMGRYQDWFQESLVFWLQTFRTECLARMEKALEIDTDLVVATSLVKFSNSSVDVLSCFAKITEEWRAIDFEDADSAVMGVTKITDLICDGARLYADKVHTILEGNCYYDADQTHFDVTERLCITLNNIEHVRQYLNELPSLLDWKAVVRRLADRHESRRVGKAAIATLRRLVGSAHADILLKSSLLLREIAERMKVELQQSMVEFLVTRPERFNSTDRCVGYLDNNLRTLHGRLTCSIYPCMLRELWDVVLTVFSSTLLTGKRPEYYEHMKSHLRCLASFFTSCGLDEEGETNPLLTELRARIDLNSLPSDRLMLDYYACLTSSVATPVDYLGHLAVKTAYVQETRGNVTLYVKVIRGSDLPGMDRSGLSDPYVTITLHPRCLFNQHKPQRTRVMGQTLQPVFNTTFQFPNVAQQYVQMRGAVMALTVYDHDRLKWDDLAGEVLLPLSSFHPLTPLSSSSSSLDDMPVVMMPLKNPPSRPPPSFTVLSERQSWDGLSKTFVKERSRLMKSGTHGQQLPAVQVFRGTSVQPAVLLHPEILPLLLLLPE
ncbi:protein unc-13 homolog D-like isoform X2 [Babylonia areolata]|uniref:protein unc-13 homolog D-like isoform X2 n=1 Tax=Babylonia areolata TaxID=304850 RepID=UPI003FCF9E66